MLYFPIVIEQICLFVIYAVLGVYAVKKGYFTSASLDVISKLLIKITIPMFARDQKSDGEYGAGMLFVSTVCSILTLPLVCLVLEQLGSMV